MLQDELGAADTGSGATHGHAAYALEGGSGWAGLIEDSMRMERRLDAQRAARNLMPERLARTEAQAESEKKILEERMERRLAAAKAATDKQLLQADIKHLKEAPQQKMASMKAAQQQQITSMKDAQQQQSVRGEDREGFGQAPRDPRAARDLAHESS